LGETRPGMVNYLAKALYSSWSLINSDKEVEIIESIEAHQELFFELLTYGPLRKETTSEAKSSEVLISNLEKRQKLPEYFFLICSK